MKPIIIKVVSLSLQALSAGIFIFTMLSCNALPDKISLRKTRLIQVQPFSGIREEETALVVAELKKVYPFVQLLPVADLPASAYLPAYNRYRADSIIEYLDRNTKSNAVTIGLTHRDISTIKNGSKDWGIMGLGFRPGKACVASTFRLSKKNRARQLFKVAVHELGHTEGLPHCPEKYCFMRDARGRNPIEEEKHFCETCAGVLLAKGWFL